MYCYNFFVSNNKEAEADSKGWGGGVAGGECAMQIRIRLVRVCSPRTYGIAVGARTYATIFLLLTFLDLRLCESVRV